MTKKHLIRIISAFACAVFCFMQILAALPAGAEEVDDRFDIIDDDIVDVTDVTYLLNVLSRISEYDERYDVNRDGEISVLDVTTLLNFIAGILPADPEQPAVELTDTLTRALIEQPSGSYSDWTYSNTQSGATYAGQSYAPVDYIQLRSKNSNSGIVTTVSGGKIASVSVVFNESTTIGNKLDIYGKSTAYSAPTDLYDANLQGTYIGSIECGTTTTLAITDAYEYVGVRSNNGALYLDSITFVWMGKGSGSGTEPEDPSVLDTPAKIVAAAYALGEGESLDQEYTLTGTVTSIDTAYNSRYGNVSVYMTVAGMENYPILCFRMKNGTNVASGEGVEVVKVGDTITVTGILTNFVKNGENIIEFAADCTLDALNTSGQSGDPTVLDTPEKIVAAAYALGAGESLDKAYTLTGAVTSIDTAYSAQYGNISVYMTVEGMENYPILCYRLKNGTGITSGSGVEILRVGDIITVTGTLTNFVKNNESTIEFKANCTLDALQRLPSVTVVETNVKYETLDELGDRLDMPYGIPSTGDVEVLVIPIGFTNSNYTNVAEKLELGFNGTPAETGWHSLSSYYNEVSFGALNIHATITDIFETGDTYDLTQGEVGEDDYLYLASALLEFEDQYDYNDFDNNGDGIIDCVYLVYLAPYGTANNHADLWWAYTSVFEETEDEMEVDGLCAFWYMWFSIEFFDEPIAKYYDDNDEYVEDDKGLTVNAETVIHETGHAMGLDDYYDYVNYVYGGLGALNMMDYNQGDHDPYSKAILGWINPTVLKSGSYETTLTSFTTTGDALFMTRYGNDTFFEEYFIISLYTPDGVNALKAPDGIGLPDEAGIVIYHVNATLKSDTSGYLIYDVCSQNNGEEIDRLIKIVEADGDDSIDNNYYFCADDMFMAGDSISLSWNDGSFTGWTLTVVSIDENGAVISIEG